MQEPKAKERASNRRRRTRAKEGGVGPAEPPSLLEEAVVEEVSAETAAEAMTLSDLDMAKTDGQAGEYDQVNAAGLPDGNGVTRLLYDNEFMDQVIKAIVANGGMDKLAGDIADKLQDLLKISPEFGRRLTETLMSNAQFRGKLVTALIRGLS